MPVQFQGNNGVVADVGGTTFRGLHIHVKPVEYGALGHYVAAARLLSTAAQTAASRLLVHRNPSTATLTVLLRLSARAIQVAAGTAQENSADCYKLTGFTAIDTTATAVLGMSLKRGTMGAIISQNRILAAAAAGMTGGTSTKDGSPFAILPYLVNTTVPTTPGAQWGPMEAVEARHDNHPFVFAQNEGFSVENRVLNVTSYGIAWWFDLSIAEVTAY